MTLTRENIHNGASNSGGWNKRQVELLGLVWPPASGWIERLVGTTIPDETYATFIKLRGARRRDRAAIATGVPDLFTQPAKASSDHNEGKSLQPTPQNFRRVVVHFDGGTPCNRPKLGYGEGYGSYNFDRGQVIRVRHGIKCSANTAEILTLCCALEVLAKEHGQRGNWHSLELGQGFKFAGTVYIDDLENSPKIYPVAVHVEGDSQIALKWLCVCAGLPVRGKSKVSKGSSPEFQAAIARLKTAVEPFAQVTCQWRGRAHAVAAFGH